MRRAGEVLRRSVRAGAIVHASSAATADAVPDAPRHRPGRGRSTSGRSPCRPAAGASTAGRHRPRLRGDAVRPRPRHAWSGARTCRSSSTAFAAGRARRRCGSCSPVPTATTAGRRGGRARAARADPRAASGASGRSTSDTKAWLLHHASVLAYPSLDEGFGFPILEAQTVGRAGRGHRAGSIPEVGGDGAELVPLGDVDALAGGPCAVSSTTSDRRRELVAAGRAQPSPRFSWAADGRRRWSALYRRRPGGRDDRDDVAVLCRRRRRGPLPARAACRSSTRGSVAAVVNTGDDTVLHGLSISPDLDTITYTLAGAIDPERGWGLAGETWQAMAALERYAAVRPAGSSAGADVVQPRRPRPRHPPLPHRPPGRGRRADRGRRRDPPGVGRRRAAAADDRRRVRPR